MRRWFIIFILLALFTAISAETNIKEGLKSVKTVVPLPYDVLLEGKVQSIEKELNRNEFYLYENFFSEEMTKHGLPIELKYLPLALSNMEMKDKWDRCGIWTLPTFVAIRYGLRISQFHDERFNIVASTDAAVQWLKELFNIYGNWWAVILAFANSPTSLNSVTLMANNNIQTWDYYKAHLLNNVEIIPRFIGCCYLLEGKSYTPSATVRDLTAVEIKNDISLDVLKKNINIDPKTFQQNNPVFRGSLIVPLSGYLIYLPKEFETAFIEKEDSIYQQTKRTLQEQKVTKNNQSEKPKQTSIYIVKKGDSLGKIAQKMHISVSELKALNYLKGDMIYEGQKLVLTRTTSKPSTKSSTTSPAKGTNSQAKIIYIVKRGDTLSAIAAKYHVKVNDIKRWNNLRNDNIREKQKLIIYKK